jgi:hypothetical protein
MLHFQEVDEGGTGSLVPAEFGAGARMPCGTSLGIVFRAQAVISVGVNKKTVPGLALSYLISSILRWHATASASVWAS